MFDLPSEPDVREVIVTKESVDGSEQPKLVMAGRRHGK
jgi:ATP-dependent protease Clp ATPase subunit